MMMLNKLSLISYSLSRVLERAAVCSRVLCAWASPVVCDWLVEGSEGVSIVVTDTRESVVGIIESLPSVSSVSHVIEVSIVERSCLFKVLLELYKVKSYKSSKFSAVEKDKELRLYSGIEVQLDKRSLITVHSDVSEPSELVSSVFVVLLNLLYDWVP